MSDTESSRREGQINCALCNSPFSEPKLLPCLHTFCLQCLTTNCNTKEFECPTCAEEFLPFDGGFLQLKSNELTKRLVHLQRTVREQSKGSSCSACSDTTDSEIGTVYRVATVYCLDCEQGLCPGCEKIHKRLKATSLHTLIGIKELRNASSRLEKIEKSEVQLCSLHPRERISLFCCNCKCSICTICRMTLHKTHNCEDIGPAAERIRNQLKQNVEDIKTWSKNHELDKEDLVTERHQYLSGVAEVAKRIEEEAEAAHNLIDEQADELLRNLKEAKSKKLQANKLSKSWHDSQLAYAEQCMQFIQNVLANGSDNDVAGLSGSIDERLRQISEAKPEVNSLDRLSFTLPSSRQSNQPTGFSFGSVQQPTQRSNTLGGAMCGLSSTALAKTSTETCLAQNNLGTIHMSSEPGTKRKNTITVCTNP